MKCPHKTHLNTKLGHRGLVQLYTTYYLSTTLSLFHCTVTRTCSMVACEGACARLEIWECLSATLISSNFKMRRRKRLTATAARSRRSFCCCFLRLANVDRISHSTNHQCHFFHIEMAFGKSGENVFPLWSCKHRRNRMLLAAAAAAAAYCIRSLEVAPVLQRVTVVK